jgi:hypothetical protein
MKKFFSIILSFIFLSQLYSQVPFPQNPDWISTDVTDVSTGGAFADIDQDGWLDFVVANGNDISRQKLVVYYNTGTGTFPTTPDWQSTDIDYHGHLDVGDVNNDGWPDVAVSVYIGPSGFGSPGKVKLYLNNSGTLSSNPDWVSGNLVYTFSCAFGDADGDGDLDLAVAGGESYNNNAEQPRIYYNISGTLESLPSWKATEAQYSYDVNWADFDEDGDLDVVFAGESSPNRIFANNNGVISLTPSWQSTDASQYANSLFVGDVNRDGFLDLLVSDNNQLGGSGKFKIYLNNNGILDSTPYWLSAFSGYGSGILLADIDNDGKDDLITGGWWNPISIYLNHNGIFNTAPEYTSNTNSVVEAIFCGDLDNDALVEDFHIYISDGSKKLIKLPFSNLQSIISVIVYPDTLSLSEYCFDLETGWLSFATIPDSGKEVAIVMKVSYDLDLGITNWDQDKGNYIFLNTSDPVFVNSEEKLLEGFVLNQNYPNPFNPSTNIGFRISNGGFVSLKVYDVLGNEITTLVDEYRPAGEYDVEFNGHSDGSWNLTSGVYFYQLNIIGPYTSLGQEIFLTKKMVLLK